MQLDDFDFELPEGLIAQYPATERSSCRLLYLHRATGEITHHHFKDLPELLQGGDTLVLNNTKVIPARFYVTKVATGRRFELLVERVLTPTRLLVQIRNSKKITIGEQLFLADQFVFNVITRHDELFELELASEQATVHELLQRYGVMPLPPYIKRSADLTDQQNYQTVYALKNGSVAAPTAGLHFDYPLFDRLEQRGVNLSYLTLHVGMGTFQPIRTLNFADHKMHAEYIEVPESVCEQIRATKAMKRQVVAVGTTTLRSLETATAADGSINPYYGDTNIFIYGEHTFHNCQGLITNFHLPKTTLMLLVCAFGGYEAVMHAYQEAIRLQYRFYSYGDAMLIL